MSGKETWLCDFGRFWKRRAVNVLGNRTWTPSCWNEELDRVKRNEWVNSKELKILFNRYFGKVMSDEVTV